MPPIRPWLLMSVLLPCLAACGDDPAPARGFPSVRLEVALEGRPDRAADVEVADDRAPTFTDGEHRAWTLESLFQRVRGAQRARVEVEQVDGTRTELPEPFDRADASVWALRVNRRGEVVLVLVDPADPFPKHHGRGGSRGRSAIPESIREVARIRVIVDPADSMTRPAPAGDRPSPETAMLKLVVTIDGAERTLDAETLADLDPIEIQGDDGKGSRDAWNVRALVNALAGADARLAVVHGQGGRLLELSAEEWTEAGRDPVLRLNRRGQLKFHWSGPDGRPQPGAELRDVSKLEITSR